MKHTFRTILVAIMAVATVAFVGCSKEESNNDNSSANGGSNGGGDVPAGWVDLGLPSGLLWAECNVGANAPEEYGDYFAWGEIQPKSVYNWSTYRYCTVDGEERLSTLTKYNTSSTYGSVDSLTILEAGDDAAIIICNGARTPTKADWEELMNNTTAKWDTVNDVYGRRFNATNGNSIFLPAAGYHYLSGLDYAGDRGFYLSSSLNTDNPLQAWHIYFNNDAQRMLNYRRINGHSVRAVRAR